MEGLTIGVLAREAGVNVETVRYYQRRGLLVEPGRPAGGVRRYGAAEVARLRFIRRARDTGFSLDEVAELLRLARTPNCRGARALAAGKLEQVEARMAELERLRAALRGLVAQCDAGEDRHCAIIDRLSAAAD
ncbi:MAG TPA: MerR family transcriptional regulator [Burkholderiales bacterium]